MRLDLSLYLVTDPELNRGRDVVAIAAAAVRGGVTVVQIREKTASARAYAAQVRRMAEALAGTGVPIIVNDRVDVARAAGAAGAHLGAEDIPWRTARDILGPDAIIGISVNSIEEAYALTDAAIDYIAVSPVYATGTKPGHTPPFGLDGLRAVRRAVGIPIVAIGGINAGNAAEVIAAGADGIAVVTALTLADDPEIAARELRALIARGRS